MPAVTRFVPVRDVLVRAGAGNADARGHEDDGQVEAKGCELGTLHGVRDPREDRDSALRAVGPDDLEEVAHLGLRQVDVFVRQHVERVVEQLEARLLCLDELAALQQRERSLWQVEAAEQQDECRNRTECEGHAPEYRVIHAGDVHDRDDDDREDLAETEHELPAGAHDLALALRHRLHDVGVAVRDVAAERNTDQRAHDDEPRDVRNEGLGERQDDEEHHRENEDAFTAEAVGNVSADQRTDECTTLHARGNEAEFGGVRGEVGLDEDHHERDRVKIPRLNEDRGNHHPATAGAGHCAALIEKDGGRLIGEGLQAGFIDA